MSNQHKTAEIEWRDGTIPVATQFDDPYFSVDNGLEETRHVFLGGNEIPARYTDGFHIAELGFGTGLNLLAAWQAWVISGQEGRLHYTSFEDYPMEIGAMYKATSLWPELCGYSEDMISHLMDGSFQIETSNLNARVIIGDARETVPAWEDSADAWFLDGFSPAKNPELWGAELMRAVAGRTNKGGTFATYTAAGHVRQSLANAGFTVTRIKGFGRKRHMTTGSL
jgi:tRNA U34 5-methylaminomethyl-2-thiouridine-forming methyltransferase MnmC